MAIRCRLCGSEDGASASLTESNGVAYYCLKCNGPCFNTDALGITHGEAPAGGESRRNPFDLRLPDNPGVAAPVAAAAGTGTAPLTTTNVLKLARARLKQVNAELRAKAKLEQEKRELERIIAAATDKRPNLVAMKGKAS